MALVRFNSPLFNLDYVVCQIFKSTKVKKHLGIFFSHHLLSQRKKVWPTVGILPFVVLGKINIYTRTLGIDFLLTHTGIHKVHKVGLVEQIEMFCRAFESTWFQKKKIPSYDSRVGQLFYSKRNDNGGWRWEKEGCWRAQAVWIKGRYVNAPKLSQRWLVNTRSLTAQTPHTKQHIVL